MDDIDMGNLQIRIKSDAALFGKYQMYLGDKERAQREYDALLEDMEYYKLSFDFLHGTYHVIQDRMLETIVRLNGQSRLAYSISRKYYRGNKPRLGRLFTSIEKRFRMESDKLKEKREALLEEMGTIEHQQKRVQEDLNDALAASITADNKYLEYCRWIDNRLDKMLKSQGVT